MIKVNKFLFIRIISFVSSIFPFSLYMFIEYNNDTYQFWGLWYITPKYAVYLLLIIQVISILYMIYFFRFGGVKRNSMNKKIIKVLELRKIKDGTTNYILANVLPIATIEMDNENKALFVIVLLTLLGYMYVRNNLLYINPIFDLIGVNVYECKCIVYNANMSFENIYEGIIISGISIYINNKYKINKTPNEVLFIENKI